MLTSWLLKYDGYPPGVVATLVLHGILLYILMPNEFEPADMVRIEPASYVVASAVKQSPQQLRRIQQLQTQQQNEERRQQAERQRQREAENERQRVAEAERQKQAEAERQRVADANRQREEEEERRRQTELERQRQAEAERQRAVAQQQEAERAARAIADAQAQQQNLSVENQLVAQYIGIIRDAVSYCWNRSPDARNGMLSVVQLRLTPTGEIVSSDIVQSSGSSTFDRSVLNAMSCADSFPELKEMPTAVFERNFRTLILEFSPEDLLR